ncbi:unnamed protein product [Triticum turgidum subsp. durum]|uniref:Uncharacterized protein n=1 Tax=Triticum turgidum subsp. durum TaxID=4567 RepID=A0A9R1PZ07_TRITD|nr:unnamed protein product [Triticum turgidum subsp. durum]
MAVKAAVTAGDVCVLKRCQQHGGQDLKEKKGTKRKAEEAPEGDESPLKVCSIRRKTAGIDCSELGQGATPATAAAARREEAPERKMTRLPQEEVDSILTKEMDDDSLPPEYKALKRHNPALIPSPEEEMDEDVVSFYNVVRFFYEIGEDFREFQAWVRTEYAKNGYVEVDDEYLRHQQEMEAMNEAARKEALKAFDFSDLLDF